MADSPTRGAWRSRADAPLSDTQLLLRALQYAATFDFPVWLRPQDPGLARGRCRARRPGATSLGLARFVCAETIALSTILLLAPKPARASFVPDVERGRLDMVRRRSARVKVSCDIAIHHAHLSEMGHRLFRPELPRTRRCAASATAMACVRH